MTTYTEQLHARYNELSTEQLNNAYNRLSEDLHLIAKGSGSIAWKRATIATTKTRLDIVLALISERTSTASHRPLTDGRLSIA